MNGIKRVLVIGPAWVGDMVMAQSLLDVLHSQSPGVAIDVVAPASSYPLLARMPLVRRPWQLAVGHGRLGLLARRRLGKRLKRERYTAAFVLPRSFKSALVPFWAGIPYRVGWRGEMRFGLLTEPRRFSRQRYPRMVERFVALAYPREALLPDNLPRPRLEPTEADRLGVLERFGLSVTGRPVLALCPGAAYGPAKRWPAEYFGALARAKQREGWAVWLLGSASEWGAARLIRNACGEQCVDLVGKTSLVDAIDLLSWASVVVANDSGLMHIAAALGRRVVAIYGSSSPGYTPPLSDPEKNRVVSLKLDCVPCFRRVCPLGEPRCLLDLEPDIVLEALADLVG